MKRFALGLALGQRRNATRKMNRLLILILVACVHLSHSSWLQFCIHVSPTSWASFLAILGIITLHYHTFKTRGIFKEVNFQNSTASSPLLSAPPHQLDDRAFQNQGLNHAFWKSNQTLHWSTLCKSSPCYHENTRSNSSQNDFIINLSILFISI